MKHSIFYEFIIVIAAICWGIISLFSKPLNELGFNAMQVVFMRAFFSAIILAIFIFFREKSFFHIKLKDIWIFLCSGLISFVFLCYCYMSSIILNGSGVAAMLMYTSPIWIIIISRFVFNEKISFVKIISLLGITIGCCCVTLGGDIKITFVGLIFGLGSGLGWGLYSIFGKLASNRGYSSETTTFYTFFFASIGSLPFCNVVNIYNQITIYPQSILYFLLIAIVSTTVAFSLFTYALKKISSGVAGILSSLEVVVAALTGYFAFGDDLGIIGIIGIIVVLLSLTFLELKKPKNQKMKSIVKVNH